MSDDINAGRRWFETYTKRLDEGVTIAASEGVRYTCPCCGYPTLGERGGYEICELCNWEDDGQDDPHADEVWGGPNGKYSLTEARENFKHYLIMYGPEDIRAREGSGFSKTYTERKRQAKRTIMQAFDSMIGETDESALDALWQRIAAAERIL